MPPEVAFKIAEVILRYRDGPPHRIQLRRTPGWRKPLGAVVVARPTRWGNPFPVIDGDRAVAVDQYRAWLPTSGLDPTELHGLDLACWCPLDQPCHADVLLELANGGDQ